MFSLHSSPSSSTIPISTVTNRLQSLSIDRHQPFNPSKAIQQSSPTSLDKHSPASFDSKITSPCIHTARQIRDTAKHLSQLMGRTIISSEDITPKILSDYSAWYLNLSNTEKSNPIFQQRLTQFLISHQISADSLFRHINKRGYANLHGSQLIAKTNGVLFNRITPSLLEQWASLHPIQNKHTCKELDRFAVKHHVLIQTLEKFCYRTGGLTLHGEQMVSLSHGHIFKKVTPALLYEYFSIVPNPELVRNIYQIKEYFAKSRNVLLYDLEQQIQFATLQPKSLNHYPITAPVYSKSPLSNNFLFSFSNQQPTSASAHGNIIEVVPTHTIKHRYHPYSKRTQSPANVEKSNTKTYKS